MRIGGARSLAIVLLGREDMRESAVQMAVSFLVYGRKTWISN
jgi:hypothetical protein